MWDNTEMLKVYETSPYKNDIIFAGRLSDDEIKEGFRCSLCANFCSGVLKDLAYQL